MENFNRNMPTYSAWVGLTFTLIFAIELLVRVLDEQRYFVCYSNVEFAWNIFDIIVVTSAICEELSVFHGGFQLNLAVLRIIRIVRLIRVLRIFRFFTDLRVMCAGLKGSVMPLVWCLVLQGLIMYVFGTCVMQLLAESVGDADGNIEGHTFIIDTFGSLYKTFYTLHITTTGGADWADIGSQLLSVSPSIGLCYVAYVSFTVLCTLNVVTGVFCQKARTIMEKDGAVMEMARTEEREKFVSALAKIFHTAGTTGTGRLYFHEFMAYCTQEEVQTCLHFLGVEVNRQNARCIFNLLDLNQDGILELDEFVSGITQIAGDAKQLDLYRSQRIALNTMVKIEDKVADLQRKLDLQINEFQRITSAGITCRDVE
eukprot:NODE_5230_length_1794_cov_7.603479.p1 GENE.NODE_5230_length_1794_cov_7.603479~~NODE_5230_length_1794_cov_7.603479.p1  ORF type:complete len:371 (+),score=107.67 NODE_5230_length_1794_cov_7.603479:510-1622(+)